MQILKEQNNGCLRSKYVKIRYRKKFGHVRSSFAKRYHLTVSKLNYIAAFLRYLLFAADVMLIFTGSYLFALESLINIETERGEEWTCNWNYLCAETDTTAKTLVTFMDPEKVQFSWIMSAAVDQKAHWLTALTTVGADTTADTMKKFQSSVLFQRQLQSVGVLTCISCEIGLCSLRAGQCHKRGVTHGNLKHGLNDRYRPIVKKLHSLKR